MRSTFYFASIGALAFWTGCSPSPEQLEERAAQKRVRAAEIVQEQTPEKQKERERLMAEFQERGFVSSIEVPAEFPKVWVTSAFYSLDFKDKQSMIGLVYAYYIKPESEYFFVRVIDNKSGKEIGRYSAANGGLEIY